MMMLVLSLPHSFTTTTNTTKVSVSQHSCQYNEYLRWIWGKISIKGMRLGIKTYGRYKECTYRVYIETSIAERSTSSFPMIKMLLAFVFGDFGQYCRRRLKCVTVKVHITKGSVLETKFIESANESAVKTETWKASSRVTLRPGKTIETPKHLCCWVICINCYRVHMGVELE